LPLARPGKIRSPAGIVGPMGNNLGDGVDRGLKAGPVRGWPQAMYRVALRTKETTEKHGFDKTGQISQDKAMPPKATTALRAGGRLGPEIFFTQSG